MEALAAQIAAGMAEATDRIKRSITGENRLIEFRRKVPGDDPDKDTKLFRRKKDKDDDK